MAGLPLYLYTVTELRWVLLPLLLWDREHSVCDAADLTLKGSVGGSVELPSVLGTVTLNEFFLLQWNFNNSEIARLRNNKEDVEIHAQFKGRLQLSSDFSLTVRELTLQDSGVYQRSGLKAVGGQIPTHTIYLSVYEKITAVQIRSDLTWLSVNQTCEVHVMCSLSDDQSASYTWRKGDQIVRGRELHFSLSPAEGGVTVTCTAHNGVSEKSRNDTVRCSYAAPPPALSPCLLKTALFSVGLVIMVSAVVTVHLRERLCGEEEEEHRTRRQSGREQGLEMK